MRAPRSTDNPSDDVAISSANSENFTSHSKIVALNFFRIDLWLVKKALASMTTFTSKYI